MPDVLNQFLLDGATDYVSIVLAIVFLAASLEAAFGLGAVVPGETVVVVAAVALRHEPMLLGVAVAAAAGAFVGDHIGFLLGRKLGTRVTGTKVVQRLGVERWEASMALVERRGFWLIVGARLLPGVRTLVSAAAGASSMPYPRFARATGTATLIWASLWAFGGAALGTALIAAVQHASIPILAGVVVLVAGVLVFRSTRPQVSA